MRKYYVYEHREADTGRTFYVGKGHGRRAWYFHNRGVYWNNVRKKHGVTVHLLCEGLSEGDAFRLEGEIIMAYGRENLCNLTDGGEGMSNPSPETRKKLSDRHKGRKLTDAQRFAISERMTGEKNVWYGKTFSDEHRLNLSKSLSGRSLSREHSEKIGKSVTKRDIFTFYNERDGSIFIGPRNEMIYFGLTRSEVSLICSGKRNIAQGWTCHGES